MASATKRAIKPTEKLVGTTFKYSKATLENLLKLTRNTGIRVFKIGERLVLLPYDTVKSILRKPKKPPVRKPKRSTPRTSKK